MTSALRRHITMIVPGDDVGSSASYNGLVGWCDGRVVRQTPAERFYAGSNPARTSIC